MTSGGAVAHPDRMGGADDLYERSALRWHRFSDWLAANFGDLVLASLAAAAIALVLIALRGVGRRLIRPRGDGETPTPLPPGQPVIVSWRIVFGRALAKTSLVFIVMVAVKLVSSQANAPWTLQRAIDILFIVTAALQAAIWGRELTIGFIEQRVGERDKESTLGSAMGIVRMLVTVTLFTIAIILILDNLGVNVTGLVAGLGIGGIAIGLAAQGIFRDLFAALSIVFDRPFRRGDVIKFDQITGTVEEIGVKSTRIRSASGEQVVVSNARLLEKEVHNFARLSRRRHSLAFTIAYATPPELAARIPEIVRDIVARHKKASFVQCGLTALGAAGIEHELQFDLRSADNQEMFAVRAAVGTEILAAFAREGIAFAEPV